MSDANKLSVLPDYMFNHMPLLKNIKYPRQNTMVEIGLCAYNNCDELETIAIPEGVITLRGQFSSIPRGGFIADCPKLSEISFPDTIAKFGVEKINDDNKTTFVNGNALIYNCVSLQEVVLPHHLPTNASNMICYCENLNTVTLPIFEDENFMYDYISNCPKLIAYSINEKDDSGYYIAMDGELYVGTGEKLVRHPYGKTGLTISDNCAAIADNAFRKCSIKDVAFPDSVVTFGRTVFYDASVESVSLGENTEQIGEQMFWNCRSLKKLYCGHSLTKIGISAFWFCTNLESIYILTKSAPYFLINDPFGNNDSTYAGREARLNGSDIAIYTAFEAEGYDDTAWTSVALNKDCSGYDLREMTVNSIIYVTITRNGEVVSDSALSPFAESESGDFRDSGIFMDSGEHAGKYRFVIPGNVSDSERLFIFTEENGELLGEILVKYKTNDYLISEPEVAAFAMDRENEPVENTSEANVSITASEYAMLMTRIKQMETILSSQFLEK